MSAPLIPPTPQEVVNAYRSTGLRPVQGYFFIRDIDDNPCGCPLFAIARSRDCDLANNEFYDQFNHGTKIRFSLGLSYDQFYEFVEGFDGGSVPRKNEWFRAGNAARLSVESSIGFVEMV